MTVAMMLGCGSSSDSGGGGAATLDCAWLAGDNCWKATANAAKACLPASTSSGTLSADNATCTYPTGQVVSFTPALTLPLPNSFNWNFTVTANGQTCMRFQETAAGGLTLTVGSQTFTQTTVGTLGIRFTCPDGTSYSNPNAFDLLNCPAGFEGMPGTGYSDTSTSANLSLLSTASSTTSSSLPVFDCNKP